MNMLSRFLIKFKKLVKNNYVTLEMGNCNVDIREYINKTSKDIEGKFSSNFISHILYSVSVLSISFFKLPLFF